MQQHVFTIAQTCEAAGIQHAIICPGSRSAPLVYAFTSSSIHCHSVVDERSAAYIALGIAQQSGKPVVIICTSGTAALNFFPAIAEAYYQHIPLIVLTADRPPELLNQQDGQMIMQKNMYGPHVKASHELPCYSPGKENFVQTKKLLTLAITQSLSGAKGPVHVNIPLREPLYPASPELVYKRPAESSITLNIQDPEISTSEQALVKDLWEKASRKLILVGQMPCDAPLTGVLQELQQCEDTVIVCDILSNQYQYNTAAHFDYLLMRADQQSLSEMEPDLIISLGGPVLSKSLKKWIQQLKPAAHIRFNDPEWNVDTYQNVTLSLTGAATPVLTQIALSSRQPEETSRFKLFWEQSEKVVATSIQQYATDSTWSELHLMQRLLSKIPDVSNVQVGNSSIIRYISYLGTVNPSWIMNGNRGTSGIDGCTSTAVGAALVNNRPTFLLTGDIAFLYDLNALWNKLPENLKIIVFNNKGGGIFQLIDGPRKHSDQLDYFTTPQQQQIGALVKARNLLHFSVTNEKELASHSAAFFNAPGSAILEIIFDRDDNARAFDIFKRINL